MRVVSVLVGVVGAVLVGVLLSIALPSAPDGGARVAPEVVFEEGALAPAATAEPSENSAGQGGADGADGEEGQGGQGCEGTSVSVGDNNCGGGDDA